MTKSIGASAPSTGIANARRLFPALKKHADTIFFDNASTTQKPETVITCINEFNTESCANAGRGEYSWSTRLSKKVEQSRAKVAEFINASPRQLAFTHGATDSLNIVATSWALNNLLDGDEVMVCLDDHQSAVLPWFNLERLLKRFGIQIRIVPFSIHYSGTYDRKSILSGLSKRTRLIALSHIHHIYGMEMDILELNKIIPRDVYISLDASQSIAHTRIDVQSLKCDFISFSGHKMFASNGAGAIWVSERAKKDIWPLRVGAKSKLSIADGVLDLDTSNLSEVLECGTLNLPGILSMAAATSFMQDIGIENIESHISSLTTHLHSLLKEIPEIEFAPGIGSCLCTRGYGIISFKVNGLSNSDLGEYLDTQNIMIRTGEHCLVSAHARSEFARISLQVYNTKNEIDQFVEVLADAYH